MSAPHAHQGHAHGAHDPARDSGLRTVEQHLEVVLSAVRVLPATRVPLGEAFGRTLAEPVVSRVDIPVFDNSAMDGFAVRSADVAAAASDHPIRLRVVADLPAGTSLDPALAPGEAARIMTGSPVPADADAIVPFEDTAGGLHGTGDIVEVRAAAAAGAHVRRRGADSVAGTEIVSAGTLLGGFQVAAAAAAGVPDVAVHHTPRVAVVSTGSELAEPGGALERGQIPESNSLLLDGLVRGAGADVVLRATVPDEVGELRAVLAEAVARGADVLITSGGVSAGAYEVVKDTFGPGGELQFTKVAMQPGKPQGFGVLEGGMLVFGLPGNPVSVAVSFETFVRPALLALQGRAQRQRDRAAPAGGRRVAHPARPAAVPARGDRSLRPCALDGATGHRRRIGLAPRRRSRGRRGVRGRSRRRARRRRRRPRGCHADSMSFTHLDAAGHARMVDVTEKQPTVRSATARGFVRCAPDIVAALRDGSVPKGDVLAVARIAGIQGAKQTPALLPLAHVIGVHGATVDLVVEDAGVAVEATVRTADRTGVEMEALTAVSVAALAIVDMVKGLDKATSIEDVRIIAKTGGKSGPWVRPGENVSASGETR